MRIWKWTLPVVDRQTLTLPVGATLLTVQMQHELPQIWALCDETTEREPRVIAIYGTGNPMSGKPGTYIATFQMMNGALVFHAFELTVKDVI